jgi:hypothetical protein
MNVANLQLEGLIMAVAAVNNLLVHTGLLTVDDIELALHKAEASLTGDERVHEDMSPANRDAICFPVRVLRMANNAQGEAEIPPFSELARMVGSTKEPYNDQR